MANMVTGFEPINCRVWGYMKTSVYAQKVNTKEEPFQRIRTVVRRINNAVVLRMFTSSLVTRDRDVSKQIEDISNNLLEC